MKILMVDDHVIVRAGARRLLCSMPKTTVIEASTESEALALFKAHRPDLILLDLNLPDSSGLELLRKLISKDRTVRILVLSMHSEPIYAGRALKAGARGYVSKMASANELLTAVREIVAGGRYVERDIAAQLVTSPYGGVNPLDRLTMREIDIFRLLGEGKNFSTIAGALGISYKTVANTCSIIKGKLGVEQTSDLIRLTYQTRDP